ncbi:hypothetical protein ABW19_dt0210018 [Dactylella cylindrospora]|nr:hypothetical protein ABW19_dt0210018 [Dactylella cylindrospora]
MSSTTYTLFDIPTKSDPPRSWSPNCWRARAVLNYKGVPYETEWIEYPDIRVRLAEMGLPSKGGLFPYTLPMLRVTITPPDGSDPQIKYLTDSLDIVKYINDNHPSPPFDFNTSPISDETDKFLQENFLNAFCGLVLPEVANILPPRSCEYFLQTRPVWMKMSVAEFQKMKIEQGAWKELEEGMKKLKEFLGRNGGPLLLGEEEVTFGDVRVLSYMIWAREGSTEEVYGKILEWGGEPLERFMKAMDEKGTMSRITY